MRIEYELKQTHRIKFLYISCDQNTYAFDVVQCFLAGIYRCSGKLLLLILNIYECDGTETVHLVVSMPINVFCWESKWHRENVERQKWDVKHLKLMKITIFSCHSLFRFVDILLFIFVDSFCSVFAQIKSNKSLNKSESRQLKSILEKCVCLHLDRLL